MYLQSLILILAAINEIRCPASPVSSSAPALSSTDEISLTNRRYRTSTHHDMSDPSVLKAYKVTQKLHLDITVASPLAIAYYVNLD